MNDLFKGLFKGSLRAAAVVFVCISFTASGAAVSIGEEQSGSELWAQNCGRCHNFRGLNEFNDAQWSIIMGHMRVVGNIPGDQARAILKFLQDNNNPPMEPGAAVKPVRAEKMAEWPMQKGDASSGKKKYDANCAACHGSSAKGDGPASVSLHPKPRNLTDGAYMGTLSDGYLFRVISEGGPSVGKSPFMPGWAATMSEEDIINVITYLRTLSK